MAVKKGADKMTSREKETVGLCPSDRAQLQRLPGSECASGAKRGLRQSGEQEPCKEDSRHSMATWLRVAKSLGISQKAKSLCYGRKKKL